MSSNNLDPVSFPPVRPRTGARGVQLSESGQNHTKRTTLYVLIACEESQAECEAFRRLGHIAYSCDLQKCRRGGRQDWHIHGDVIPYLEGRTEFVTMDGEFHRVPQWDLIVAHPPCTYLCKVGAQWLFQNLQGGEEINHDRLHRMDEARKFFYQCYNARAPFVAVENPLPQARAQLPKPSCYASPAWFGSKYSKKTLYWLRNLPPLMPEVITPNPVSLMKSRRGKYRSRTMPELADALARQWSTFILEQHNNRTEATLR